MSAFVVITEDYYGGEDNLRVFRQESRAKAFAETISNDTDRIIFETSLPGNSNKVFVAVTEEYYGGGTGKIKLFTTREEAEKYGGSINDNMKLDTMALERIVA